MGSRRCRVGLFCLALVGSLAVAAADERQQLFRPIEPIVRVAPRFGARLIETGQLVGAVQGRQLFGVDGSGLTVAVLDTGLRTTHLDFAAPGKIPAQANFTADNGGNPADASDGQGHGTNVAGIIAADGGPAGHTGIAPGARVIPLKVLDNTGVGTGQMLLDALDWVLANRAVHNITVCNLSLGGSDNLQAAPASSLFRDRLAALRAAGVAVCVAAGNGFADHNSQQGMSTPGIFPETISVGAVFDANVGGVAGSNWTATTTAADRFAPFSQRLHESLNPTDRTDLFAPGVFLTATGHTDDTATSSQGGTSQATPVVAGCCLLLQQRCLQVFGQLPTVDELETLLRLTGAPIVDGDDEDDSVTNTGLTWPRVNVLAALGAIQSPAARLAFIQQPGDTSLGQALAPPITVAIQDAGGQTVTSATNPVTLALAANPGGAQLGGTLTVNAVNGVATFADLTLDRAGAGYTLAASAAGLTGAVSEPFDVAPGLGPPARLAFVVEPSTTGAGSAFSPPVQVVVQDVAGQTVPTAENPITIAFGTNPTGATLSGTTTRAAYAGVAQFADLTIARAGSGYTLTASSPGLAGATSASFDIFHLVPAELSFVTQPPDGLAGQPLAPPVQVAFLDAFGNIVTDSTAAITLSLGTNPTDASLLGTTTRAAVAGVATFDDLFLDRAGSGYDLVASTIGLTAVTSEPFDISSGAPARLAFRVGPSDAVAGQALAPPLEVELLDALGNRVPAALAVTLELATNPTGATLGGTTTVTSVGGVATFADLTVDRPGAGYTLRATAPGLTEATSTSFAVVAGAAAGLRFLVEPSDTTGGAILTPAVEVQLIDALGNAVEGTADITLALGTNPAGGTLGGIPTRAAVDGVATFTDLTIDRAGVGYTLVATAPGLTGAESAAFDVLVGPPDPLTGALAAEPLVQIADGVSEIVVSVTVRDAGGNPLVGLPGEEVQVAAEPAEGVTVVQPTSPTDATGTTTARLTAVTAGRTTLRATVTGVPLAATVEVTFTAVPPDAATSTVSLEPSVIAADGRAFATLTVVVRDAGGQPLAGVGPAERTVGGTSETGADGLELLDLDGPTAADGTFRIRVKAAVVDRYTLTVIVRGVALAAVELEARTAFTATLPAGLRFFGLPFVADDPRPLGVLGNDGYQLARYDASANAFVGFQAAHNDDPQFALAPGRGFWGRFPADFPLQTLGEPWTTGPADLPLRRGWNTLANPYVTDLPWRLDQLQVVLDGAARSLADPAVWSSVAPYVWIFDGTVHRLVFDPTVPGLPTTLAAVPRLAGFWVYSAVDGAALRLPATRAPGRATRAPVSPGEWSLDLLATSADGEAACLVGVSRAVERELTIARPPAVGQTGLTLNLVAGERRLAGELRRGGGEQTWLVEAVSPTAGEVTLHWPGLLRGLPRGVVAELTDERSGRTALLNTTAAYAYTAEAGEARRFWLRVAPGRLARAEILTVRVAPGRAGGWAIDLTLTDAATLAATVRGLGGRPLRQLTGQGGPGTVTLVWDGLDEAGRPVPAGTYQLEVTAHAANGALTRAVRTVVVR